MSNGHGDKMQNAMDAIGRLGCRVAELERYDYNFLEKRTKLLMVNHDIVEADCNGLVSSMRELDSTMKRRFMEVEDTPVYQAACINDLTKAITKLQFEQQQRDASHNALCDVVQDLAKGIYSHGIYGDGVFDGDISKACLPQPSEQVTDTDSDSYNKDLADTFMGSEQEDDGDVNLDYGAQPEEAEDEPQDSEDVYDGGATLTQQKGLHNEHIQPTDTPVSSVQLDNEALPNDSVDAKLSALREAFSTRDTVKIVLVANKTIYRPMDNWELVEMEKIVRPILEAYERRAISFHRNADYWRERAEKAEAELEGANLMIKARRAIEEKQREQITALKAEVKDAKWVKRVKNRMEEEETALIVERDKRIVELEAKVSGLKAEFFDYWNVQVVVLKEEVEALKAERDAMLPCVEVLRSIDGLDCTTATFQRIQQALATLDALNESEG